MTLHTIRTVADFHAVPEADREVCLRTFAEWLANTETANRRMNAAGLMPENFTAFYWGSTPFCREEL